MTVSIKETSATLRTIELSIPQESLKVPFDKKVTKYRKEVTFKGFRQGQVPKQMILSRFGDAIRQEALDELLNQTLTDELKKAGINPVGRVKVEEFKDDKENDISLKATVEVDPVIDIQGYDSLGISVPEILVSDAEVDEELARLRQMWSKDESAARASRIGDVVTGNYLEVVIDGVGKDIPEEKEFRSLLGESSTPGFDQGLVGVSKGDIKEVDFVYPEDHRDEAYRGKTAKFKVEITDVREVTPPAMDEEFFKQIGVKDMEELRNNLAEGLANSKKQAAKAKTVTEAVELLIEKNPFEVPQGRILDLIRYTLKRHQQAAEDEEIEPTEEQVKTLTPEAIREIKRHRILDFVATKEKLKATQAQVDARLEELAKSYHVDFESMKNYFRQSGRIMSLREELRIEAAADFLVGIRPEVSANS